MSAAKKRPAAPGATSHYKRWTPVDDEKLRLGWGDGTLEGLAAKLGRSVATVYARAWGLGLPSTVPQGSESLTAAAKRTGFGTGQLRALLRAAKVPVSRAFARPRATSKTGRRFHFVSPDLVDAVVEGWGRTEIVHRAAAARGTNGETLRRWLQAAGHQPPRGSKQRWRVDTVVIDAVVTAVRAQFSVAAHARRIGLGRCTLAKKLRAAGVLGQRRPGVEVRLSVEVVDRALGRE